MYTASKICDILGSDKSLLSNPGAKVSRISMDTRKIENPAETIFFALSGSMHDGHDFIHEAIAKGITNIVAENVPGLVTGAINIYIVPNSLLALQQLAKNHRTSFPALEVIAITGSNGKTTIKEWLYQLIQDRQVVKSPKSYNSQTGVPLSVWQISEGDALGIFEAGISLPNEMQALQEIIQPSLGLFTFLGDAHAEGFTDRSQKLAEKLNLFTHCTKIIFEEDNADVATAIRTRYADKKLISWGNSDEATLFTITNTSKNNDTSVINIVMQGMEYAVKIPFTDSASIQNVLHCIAVLLTLGMSLDEIKSGLTKLQNIPMRLEMKNGIHDSILINDTYNADIQSFKIALEFLSQQAGSKEKVLILSDFMQTGLDEDKLNHQLANLIHTHDIVHVVGIGTNIKSIEKFLDPFILFNCYQTTEQLIAKLPTLRVDNKAILVKGARSFQLENVIQALSDKAHSATLETDLQCIEKNLKIFSQLLPPATQIIAVIKASAYGSGSEELARFLEFKKVGYLAVAFIDEGIQLRQSGIVLPIIILNPDRNGVMDMIKYRLEPEVYSLDQIKEIISIVAQNIHITFHIHIKVDTGMHRLGFSQADITELGELLRNNQQIKVVSIFSHLSSSEDPGDDAYTHQQASNLNIAFQKLTDILQYKPYKHILNSSGIIRLPQYHYDMVRLGLGLYGIDSTETITPHLDKVHTLKATVVQIKEVTENDYIGYNRKGRPSQNGRIAIVNIGYADGLMRMAGNGRYSLGIHDRDFPIIGNVCMDLTILDIGNATDISVGDEVIVFGKSKPIETLATVCQTIPYEILSRISSRVRRLYVQG